jgi:hypothetical protein
MTITVVPELFETVSVAGNNVLVTSCFGRNVHGCSDPFCTQWEIRTAVPGVDVPFHAWTCEFAPAIETVEQGTVESFVDAVERIGAVPAHARQQRTIKLTSDRTMKATTARKIRTACVINGGQILGTDAFLRGLVARGFITPVWTGYRLFGGMVTPSGQARAEEVLS